jgi:hypothetical protein
MTTKKKETTFEMLSKINVNKFVEKKNGLTYLSWAYAWSEVKKNCPDATYEIGETTYDDALGFMCNTSVTIDGETLPMWLPVMDGANKSMKKQPYKYSTRYGEKSVEAATTFDINKTMMRCLVKNLAMFGLGIYIFAGDDIPTSEVQDEVKEIALIPLKKDDDNWSKVSAFVKANKSKGIDTILDQLKTKYTISTSTKSELQKLLK